MVHRSHHFTPAAAQQLALDFALFTVPQGCGVIPDLSVGQVFGSGAIFSPVMPNTLVGVVSPDEFSDSIERINLAGKSKYSCKKCSLLCGYVAALMCCGILMFVIPMIAGQQDVSIYFIMPPALGALTVFVPCGFWIWFFFQRKRLVAAQSLVVDSENEQYSSTERRPVPATWQLRQTGTTFNLHISSGAGLGQWEHTLSAATQIIGDGSGSAFAAAAALSGLANANANANAVANPTGFGAAGAPVVWRGAGAGATISAPILQPQQHRLQGHPQYGARYAGLGYGAAGAGAGARAGEGTIPVQPQQQQPAYHALAPDYAATAPYPARYPPPTPYSSPPAPVPAPASSSSSSSDPNSSLHSSLLASNHESSDSASWTSGEYVYGRTPNTGLAPVALSTPKQYTPPISSSQFQSLAPGLAPTVAPTGTDSIMVPVTIPVDSITCAQCSRIVPRGTMYCQCGAQVAFGY